MSSFTFKGAQQPHDYFTGTVFANIVVTPADGLDSVIGNVTFEAMGRTNWHVHPAGQILLVTSGVGYYQEQGKPAQIIREGDVVKIAPDVRHWHGASHQSSLTHIAIVPSARPDGTDWQQPVTQQEYNAAAPTASASPAAVQLSETAMRNYEQLWPAQPSAQTTDPDLVAVFHNFAFGDVASHNELDVKTRLLALLAATIGGRALSQYRQLLDAALTAGITPVEIKEVLYQVVPYVGMARVLDFLQATNQRFVEEGIELPLESQSTTTPETRFDAGYTVQRIVVGAKLDDLHKNAPQDLLHFQKFLSANCFGDYFTRKGLDHQTREIVILSTLIALGGTEPQIKGHLQGNANVGNDRQTLINVITQLLPYVGYPRTLNAVACLNEILPPA